MTNRNRLHQLIDQLPEGHTTLAAERSLIHLLDFADDPVLKALMNAPIDDEPLTDEERAAVAEGLADLESGDVISDDDLRRELGL
jgi:hypothetical protein